MTTGTAQHVEHLLSAISQDHSPVPLFVGISGIDASGKSTLARTLAGELAARAIPAASLNIDWFHTPATVRFLPPHRRAEPPESHGRHFFDHAFRWEELFGKVVDPLLATGECRADIGVHDMKADAIKLARIEHRAVRVVILEGIFIFRREYADRFHMRLWIDCPFELALQRALARNQEGLSPDAIRADYRRIYLPAQRYHLERDRPSDRAHSVLVAPASSR